MGGEILAPRLCVVHRRMPSSSALTFPWHGTADRMCSENMIYSKSLQVPYYRGEMHRFACIPMVHNHHHRANHCHSGEEWLSTFRIYLLHRNIIEKLNKSLQTRPLTESECRDFATHEFPNSFDMRTLEVAVATGRNKTFQIFLSQCASVTTMTNTLGNRSVIIVIHRNQNQSIILANCFCSSKR